MSNVTTNAFNATTPLDYVTFLSPFVYGIAILFPFLTNNLFRRTNEAYHVNNKTIYASLKNLTKSNNKYYVGNYYNLQLNVTELFEDLIMTTDTYDFLNKTFSTDSTTINIEFTNENMDKTWNNVNKLLELITTDLRIDNLYILVSEQSIDFKELVQTPTSVKIVNVLDLYGYLNPKIRKICFQTSATEEIQEGSNVLFDCEDANDVIECSSCEEDEDDVEEETMSKLDRTINTFRYLKKNYKNIYKIMNCI